MLSVADTKQNSNYIYKSRSFAGYEALSSVADLPVHYI
jgi:hypothetical protein